LTQWACSIDIFAKYKIITKQKNDIYAYHTCMHVQESDIPYQLSCETIYP
jgi:hypothetical protein